MTTAKTTTPDTVLQHIIETAYARANKPAETDPDRTFLTNNPVYTAATTLRTLATTPEVRKGRIHTVQNNDTEYVVTGIYNDKQYIFDPVENTAEPGHAPPNTYSVTDLLDGDCANDELVLWYVLVQTQDDVVTNWGYDNITNTPRDVFDGECHALAENLVKQVDHVWTEQHPHEPGNHSRVDAYIMYGTSRADLPSPEPDWATGTNARPSRYDVDAGHGHVWVEAVKADADTHTRYTMDLYARTPPRSETRGEPLLTADRPASYLPCDDGRIGADEVRQNPDGDWVRYRR